jgi:hypothetical protein
MPPTTIPHELPALLPFPTPTGDRDDAAALSIFGTISSLLAELPASWHAATAVPDRRAEPRFRCDCTALLTPLDEGEVATAEPVRVAIADISRHGIGLIHREPLPHRQALITIESFGDAPVQFIVRLKWCRFKSPERYESGGQIVRVLEPDQATQTFPRSALPTEPARTGD